jgi:hypothetical protein
MPPNQHARQVFNYPPAFTAHHNGIEGQRSQRRSLGLPSWGLEQNKSKRTVISMADIAKRQLSASKPLLPLALAGLNRSCPGRCVEPNLRSRPKPEEVALNTLLDRYARFRIFKQETPETTAN